ncbi:MAG: type II toxin-antitoxin system RelE/ParE family toxin [Chlorobiaceae bacterium]|jgi:toxin ParE1/3/4|nr:type II toxin-antitoxin system RelE/ParE family toxin [Chlorobiaceae bacterium]
MAQIRWTHQAADDLEAITMFIAADSSSYAKLFAIDVLSVVDRLSEFPMSGRVVPELYDPSVREVLFGNYRIVYRLNGDQVEILSIYHSARLLDPGSSGLTHL